MDTAQIRERLAKVTPWPWMAAESGNSVISHCVKSVAYDGQPQKNICSAISPKTGNADFIAHAPEDMQSLLNQHDEDREIALEQGRRIARLETAIAERCKEIDQLRKHYTVKMIKRNFNGKGDVTCDKCNSVVIKGSGVGEYSLKYPYCGACGKAILDANHKYCGWCGTVIDWKGGGE